MRHHSSFAQHKVSLAAIAALLALAPAARATVIVTLGGVSSAGSTTTTSTSTSKIYYFGLAACAGTDPTNHPSTVTGTYNFSADSFSSLSPTVAVFATPDSTCTRPTSTATGRIIAFSSTGTGTGTFSVTLPELLFDGTCTTSDAGPSNPGSAFICVTVTASGASSTEDTGYLQVEYSMVPPAPPPVSGFDIASGNDQLHVSWTAADSSVTITDWHLYCEPDATDGGSPVFDITKYSTDVTAGLSGTVTKTSIEQAPLVNGQTYSIAITATDSFGNESALSGVKSGNIPYPVDDFYEYYRDKGGSALGCASSDGAAWMALIAGVLFVGYRARKRTARRGAAGIVLGLSLLAAGSARAADSDYAVTDFSVPSVRAPRRFFFGLEFDRYKPQVDSEKDLNGATPYMDIFQHRVPWRVQAELGIEVFHSPAGTFIAGISAGFWQNIGKGRFAGGPDDGKPSSDTTLFDIWPVGVEAQFRFDMLADRIRWFPLIPYAKAGLMGGIWAIYSGNGDVSSSSSTSATPNSPARTSGRGQGITYGYTTALGCAIALDAITPGISNEAYQDLGLQRTSVFAEYGWTRLDGFHSSGNLILTDRGWRFGLSLEF